MRFDLQTNHGSVFFCNEIHLLICRKEIEDKDAELVKLKETVKEKNEQEKVLKGLF